MFLEKEGAHIRKRKAGGQSSGGELPGYWNRARPGACVNWTGQISPWTQAKKIIERF